jgi:hypothetical protein
LESRAWINLKRLHENIYRALLACRFGIEYCCIQSKAIVRVLRVICSGFRQFDTCCMGRDSRSSSEPNRLSKVTRCLREIGWRHIRIHLDRHPFLVVTETMLALNKGQICGPINLLTSANFRVAVSPQGRPSSHEVTGESFGGSRQSGAKPSSIECEEEEKEPLEGVVDAALNLLVTSQNRICHYLSDTSRSAS